MDTLKHIHALQEAAVSLEHEVRANGRYSKDCDRVSDAIVRGQKSGVALLWGQDGKMEIVDLNNGSAHVRVRETGDNGVTIEHDFPTWEKPEREEQRRDETRKIVEEAAESYEAMGGENFEKAKSRSHERERETKGRFEPQSHATGDKARLNAELKAKQTADAAREKSIRLAGIQKTEKIAQQMKEASNKQWNNGRIA